MATYDEWLDAYDAIYDRIPGPLGQPCPNCGHDALRVLFTGDPERLIGYAYFWCDNCRQGIHLSRTSIPEGAPMRDIRQPAEERFPKPPTYEVVR